MISNENILSIFLTCIYSDFQKRSQKPFDLFSLNIMTNLPLIICEKICISYSPLSNKLDLNTFITIIKKLFFCYHFEDKLTLLTNIVDYKHRTIISKHTIKLLFTHLHTHIIDYSKKALLDEIIDDFFDNESELSFTEFYRKSKSTNPNLVYVFSLLIDKYNFGDQKEQLQLFNELIFEGEEDINEYVNGNYTIDNISTNAMLYANIIKHETKRKNSGYINNLLLCNGTVNNELNELDNFENDLAETVNNGFAIIEEKLNCHIKNRVSLSTYYGSSYNQTEASSNTHVNVNVTSSIVSEENQRIKKMMLLLTQKNKYINIINRTNVYNPLIPRKSNSTIRLFTNPLQSTEHYYASNHNVLFCFKSSQKTKQFQKVKLIHIGSLLFYFKHSHLRCSSPNKYDKRHTSSLTEQSKYTLKRIILVKNLFISIMQSSIKKDFFQIQLLSQIKQIQAVKNFYSQNEKLLQTFRKKIYHSQKQHYKPIDEMYVIGQEIGYGQFGHVFKSIHRETSTTVSIKVINKNELHKHSSINTAFWGKDVFTFLMNCNNKDDECKDNNIVKCYEYFETSDKLYYVMEYIPHGTIKDYIHDNSGELSMKQVNAITKQMVNAIAFLHRNGIMHRDIKLTNALIVKGNDNNDCCCCYLKLIDFGLSRVICHDDWIKTNSGTFMYKAPEIIFGNNYTLNADIWSLGVCVYVMIFGNFPIEEKDKKIYKEKLLRDNFNFLEKILMKKPKGINDSDLGIKVMFGALVKDPNKRVNVNKLVKILNKY